MALRIAPCLLSFLMLLAINGLPSSARDLKLQQEEQVGTKQPYLDGWLKDKQADDKHGRNSNAAYLDGWLKNTEDHRQKPSSIQKPLYLDGWLKDAQNGKQKSDSDQVYLDGWLKDSHDGKHKSSSDHVYLDGWLKDTQKGKQNSHSQQVYLDGWLKDAHHDEHKSDSDQVYLDGWLKNAHDGNQKASSDQDGNQKSTHSSNKVYLDGWLKTTPQGNGKTTPSSNEAYLDGWLKDSKDVRGKLSQKLNQVYLDGWLKDTTRSDKATHNQYLDGWLKDGQNEKGKTNQEVFLDGWLKDTKEGKANNQVYLDGWLKDNKKTSQENMEGKQSPKVDHTEAFKLAFFTLDDLYVGNVMTLEFPIREYAPFLPRKQAEAIPFSRSQVPSLLQLFKLTEDSAQGQDMKDIIDQCEYAPTKGETKACPTSVDSMVEFVQSVLGAETKYSIHSTSYPTTSGARMQNYTVLGISEDIYAPKWVACHPRPYPYALYYCHYLDIGSKVFKVLLGGEYGDLMDALGICHLDTSDMNPNHILFQYLGMRPGEAPLCHFFPVKHLLWVPLAPDATI